MVRIDHSSQGKTSYMTLQEALLRRHVKYKVGTDRNKIQICCPFCTSRGKAPDDKFRLCLHATQFWCRCVHCEWKRKNGIATVLKELGIVEQVYGVEEHKPEKAEPVELPSDFQILTKAYDDLDQIARRYVLERGITEEQIRKYQIGVSYTGRYSYRIVFPVYNGKELVGINSRDFTGQATPKYLTSRGDKFLFGFDPLAHSLVLSEGCFKALRISRVTKYCSSALLGHDLTDKQLQQLQASKVERIILYPDIDEVGKRGFVKIADKLQEELKATVSIAWPVGMPADEAPLEDIRTLLANPLPYSWSTRQKLLLTLPK